jgi:predicted NBD/HSP70 family sugar kinase
VRRGTNLFAVGGFNQAVVLDLIRRAPSGLSRVEIASATGLSAQTVSNVSRRLLDAGIVLEAGKVGVGPGKPRTLLQLVPTGLYAIGVHLDPTVITYVLLDLAGTVVADHRTPAPTGIGPDEAVGAMAEQIEGIMARSGVARERVLGVGIAAPGPVDSPLGMLLNPPLLDGWTRVPLRESLAAATGFAVVLEKDVAAAAVAELWTAEGSSRDNFTFFYYGTGTGMGLVVDREVLRGSSSNAGDMGHILVDSDGPVCTCGRRGCIGVLVPPHLLVEQAALAGLDTAAAASVDSAFTVFAAAAAVGDPAAVAILDRVARHIAAAVVITTNLLDVESVIFGGPFWHRVADVLLPRIRGYVHADRALIAPHPIAIASSAIGDDVAAIGAGCLVLDHALSPRPSTLLISE